MFSVSSTNVSSYSHLTLMFANKTIFHHNITGNRSAISVQFTQMDITANPIRKFRSFTCGLNVG